MYNEGISKAGSVLDVGVELGIVRKSGAWFYLDASNGEDNLQLDADALTDLVKDSSLTSEIDALRTLECK